MLDNLVNADLSGLTGKIYYSYDSMSQVIVPLITVVLFFVTLWIVFSLLENRRTYNYRKKLMDMYVAGTIRKLAKADSIDIEEEYREFIRAEKKMKTQQKELDDVVEQKLKEEVTEETRKHQL